MRAKFLAFQMLLVRSTTDQPAWESEQSVDIHMHCKTKCSRKTILEEMIINFVGDDETEYTE